MAELEAKRDEHEQVRPLVIVEQLRQSVPGGIGRYVTELCRALQRTGPIDTFSSLGKVAWPSADPVDSFRSAHYPEPLPHKVAGKLWERSISLSRAVRRAEVVHATSFATPSVIHPRMTMFIHDVCWRQFPDSYTPRGVAWHEGQLQRVLRSPVAIIVPSQRVRTDLLDAGFASERVTVVSEGANHLPVLRRNETSPILLSVCTLQPRKNLARLIEAYKIVRARGVDLPLVLVGPQGWGHDLGRQYGSILGIEFVGHVSDVELAELYSRAAQLVFVPLAEGFGLPVVEAWQAGVPVVASYGVPVAVEHPGATELVDPLYPEQIADAMLRLLHENASQKSSRLTAASNYINVLSWDATAAAHRTVWDALCA